MRRHLLFVALAIAGALFASACNDGDSSGDDPTPTASAPAATASPTAAGAPTPTPTIAGSTNARQVLDAYIRDQLGEENIGACPQSMVPGQQPGGICTRLLYESAELTTFVLGVPFSEGIGELVLTRNAPGEVWNVEFVPAPVLGEEIAVGKIAIVFGAGDCLNFRENPNPNAPVFTCALDGTKGQVFEGPLQSGGIVWWRVGDLGWASAEFLGVAAD